MLIFFQVLKYDDQQNNSEGENWDYISGLKSKFAKKNKKNGIGKNNIRSCIRTWEFELSARMGMWYGISFAYKRIPQTELCECFY